MELNKIYQIDACDGMQKLDDHSVDLVLADPPYGIDIAEWDKSAPPQRYFDEMFRVSENQIIFGGNFFELPVTESWLVWYKDPFLPSQAEAELIWTSLDIKPRVIHYRYAGNCEGYPGELEVDYDKKSMHPAQKPVEIIRNILKDYSEKGDLILDPFIGSGTTGIAARALNRDFIGFEKNEEYIEIARKRLSSVQKEL